MTQGWAPTAVIEHRQRPWAVAGRADELLIVTISESWTVDERGNVETHGKPPIMWNADKWLLPAGPNNVVAIADNGQAALLGADGWSAIEPVPDTRWILGSGFTEGTLYVVTVASRSGNAPPGSLLALDIVEGSWRNLGDLPVKMNVGGVAVQDDAVFILGSHKGNNNETLNSQSLALLRYDPLAKTFDELPAPPISGQAASIGSDGSDLVAWNYEAEMSVLTPDGWTRPARPPLDMSECPPRSITLADSFVADFCGQIALYSGGWVPMGSIDYEALHGATMQNIWAVVPEAGRIDVYQRPNDTRLASLKPSCDPTEGGGQPSFYAYCPAWGGPPRPIYRGDYEVTLEEALNSLLIGTTAEERERGLMTGFDRIEGGASVEFELTNGILDFEILADGEPWKPGSMASTSSSLLSFIEPLYATAFAFPEVTRIDMSTHCWGEMGCGESVSRSDWVDSLFQNDHVLLHEGCDLAQSYFQPRCNAVTQTTIGSAIVQVDSDDILNMRTAADPSAGTIGALRPGDLVAVTRASAVAPDGGLWVLVWAPSGQPGWVNNAYLAYELTTQESIIHTIIEFARHPSDETFAAIPLAENVTLGLWDDHTRLVSAAALRDPAAWIMDADIWAAYVGPFDMLRSAGRDESMQYRIGPHDHCAGPPLAAPGGFEFHTQISAEPAELTVQTCMQWSSLNVFVNDDNLIEGIFLDIWEP